MKMKRASCTVLVSLLGFAGAAAAQTAYDPAISFTQAQGKSVSLYVANADGSHAVRVASSNGNITGADFAPGGGRIAYSGSDGVRVVSYSASNSGVVVNATSTLATGTASSPDFSSDGTRVLYYQNGGYRAVPAGGGASMLLHSDVGLGVCHWLRAADMGNAFAYLDMSSSGPNQPVIYEVKIVLLDGTDHVTSVSTVVTTATQAFGAIDDFDVARTRNALLLTANYPTTVRFVDYDIGTAQLVDRGGNGFRGHYDATDAAIVYREDVKGGNFVDRLDLGSGVATRLTAKGNYGAIDARP
jgi:hypothetical protein